MNAFLRAAAAAVLLAAWSGILHAAPDCAPATSPAKGGEPIVDWYETYIRPYRSVPGGVPARPAKGQVEAFIEELAPFHRRAVLDPLVFETLVQQIVAGYARRPDFRGIDTAAVEKIYNPGTGDKFDFSMLCIRPRSLVTPDDAFSITLFGVVVDDCQHIGLLGLVFTGALVNGSANGQCRPDQTYTKMFILPLPAGTNEITFICGKDTAGCARR